MARQGGGQERRGPLRLAVVGGRRGHGFDRALSVLEDTVRLTAVCDLIVM